MAILEILHYPDARLKQIASPVTRFDHELQAFLVDFLETMRAAPGCVGLAAPQVGRPERIVAVDVSGRPKIRHNGPMLLINPEVIGQEGEGLGREGCLSVPDFTGNVVRAQRVRVRAVDAEGVQCEFICEGYEARAVLHEIDHLDGLLFLDRVVNPRADLFRRKVYK